MVITEWTLFLFLNNICQPMATGQKNKYIYAYKCIDSAAVPVHPKYTSRMRGYVRGGAYIKFVFFPQLPH